MRIDGIRKYITVFPGIRDQYQVPVALWKNDRLEQFVTDYYDKGVASVVFKMLGKEAMIQKRAVPGLPDSLVSSRPHVNLTSRIQSRFFQGSQVSVWEDDKFGRIAADEAKRKKSNLLLYEFQADYAFKQSYAHDIIKILFHFHPHPSWEHPVLCTYAQGNDQIYQEVLENTRSNLSERYRNHTRSAWKNADHVIVASGITKYSLLEAGCPDDRISVVPYGFEMMDAIMPVNSQASTRDKPYFLYVGSGSYRKGLFHLCNAWKAAGLAKDYSLVVISRRVDASLQALLRSSGAEWIQGVSRGELVAYYRGALCFVMPSLSEGFGQVYLEALSNGCPVIGTRHSMLPDIPGGSNHILLAEPGNEQSIAALLQTVAGKNSSDIFFHKNAIKKLVSPYTWATFRTSLNTILAQFD